MKTKTITVHALDNCGSGLQAYALQQALIQHGIENEIIDYRPWYIYNNGRPLDWKFFVKRILYRKALKRRWEIYNKFISDSLITTEKTYKNYEELYADNLKADFFIAGSDQIWNSYFECGKDPVYYLAFIENQRKISYAASLGRTSFDSNKMKFMKKNVESFEMVTVREKSACMVLSSIGIHSEQVCDPTFLISAEQYRKNEHKVLDEKFGKYILVYLTEASKLLDKVVEKLRNRYQAKIVYVGSFRNRCKCDVNLTDIGPWEFLDLIDGASYVIAGSFHASVFSSILKRNFAVVPYENNIRMEELLSAFELQDHFIRNESDMKILDLDITQEQFARIDAIIESWKNHAEDVFFDYLKKMEEHNE